MFMWMVRPEKCRSAIAKRLNQSQNSSLQKCTVSMLAGLKREKKGTYTASAFGKFSPVFTAQLMNQVFFSCVCSGAMMYVKSSEYE